MKALNRSEATQIKCNGCGRPVLVFPDNQVSHETPECAWFRTLMESQASGAIETKLVEVKDDVSN